MSASRQLAEKSVIFLIGFSGTGKSHVGHLVAGKLGWEHVDTDDLITRKAGGAWRRL